MQREVKPNFEEVHPFNMPLEILIKITEYCSPEVIILILSRVDRAFYLASQSSLLWDFKLNLHFPSIYQQKKLVNTPIEFSDFKKAYTQTYKLESDLQKLDTSEKIKAHNVALKTATLCSAVIEDRVDVFTDPNLIGVDAIPEKNRNDVHRNVYILKSPKILAQIWADRKKLFEVNGVIDIKKKKQDSGTSILHHAAQTNQTTELEKLIASMPAEDRNVDPVSNFGFTPLFTATQYNNPEVVRVLLENGADPNKAAHDGVNPLMMAAKNGYLAILEALIAKGADVNFSENFGCTPLVLAAKYGFLEIVNVLLNNGAQINQGGLRDSTALYQAAENGHLAIVKALLERGAEVNKTILNHSKTPLWGAAISVNHNPEIINTLLAAGAAIYPLNLSEVKLLETSRTLPILELKKSNTLRDGIILSKPKTKKLPNISINVSMILALEKMIQFLGQGSDHRSQSKTMKRSSLRDLIHLIYQNIQQPFSELVNQWRSKPHPRNPRATNAVIIAAADLYAPIENFFSGAETKTTSEEELNKNNITFLIDDLVKHAELYSAPLCAQDNMHSSIKPSQGSS